MSADTDTMVSSTKRAADVKRRRRRLARYVTWTAEDLAEFEQALAEQRTIDGEVWR